MGIGSARGKLLLFGEHAAVYGHPAVGLTLPWSLTVESQAATGWELPGLGPHTAEVRALVSRLESIADEEGLATPVPCRLGFHTAIPLSSGFGSSGALCAALVNLFWPDQPLTVRDRLAWNAEGLFHGTPSGIDTALALREGWWALDTSTKPVAARALPDPGLVLVAGSVVREGHTKELVADIGRRRQREPAVRETLDLLGNLAAQAIVEVERGRSGALTPLVQQARAALADLGLESARLTAVLEAGLAQPGALAGKLSGAGGGGAFFLLFDDREKAAAALSAIEAAGADGWTALPRVV